MLFCDNPPVRRLEQNGCRLLRLWISVSLTGYDIHKKKIVRSVTISWFCAHSIGRCTSFVEPDTRNRCASLNQLILGNATLFMNHSWIMLRALTSSWLFLQISILIASIYVASVIKGHVDSTCNRLSQRDTFLSGWLVLLQMLFSWKRN